MFCLLVIEVGLFLYKHITLSWTITWLTTFLKCCQELFIVKATFTCCQTTSENNQDKLSTCFMALIFQIQSLMFKITGQFVHRFQLKPSLFSYLQRISWSKIWLAILCVVFLRTLSKASICIAFSFLNSLKKADSRGWFQTYMNQLHRGISLLYRFI